MSDRAATGRTIWRAWRGTQHLVLAGISIALLHVWSGSVLVPGRDDVAQSIWPLAPTFLAFACLEGAQCAQRDTDRLAARGAGVLRCSYVVVFSVFVLVATGPSGPFADRWVLVRNDALLCGLALLAVELLRPGTAWVPLVVLPMGTWLLGSNGPGVAPEPWAVLLHGRGSSSAAAVSLLVLAAGLTGYVSQPARVEGQRAVLRRRSVSGVRSGR